MDRFIFCRSRCTSRCHSVTVFDLGAGSLGTSAFYLKSIYEVFADQNVKRTPISFPAAKPTPLSPPIYAVWPNILRILSLVMSLSCALWAISSWTNGRVDVSASLSLRDAVQRDERECIHALPMALISCIFRGQLKEGQRCYISSCSSSLHDGVLIDHTAAIDLTR